MGGCALHYCALVERFHVFSARRAAAATTLRGRLTVVKAGGARRSLPRLAAVRFVVVLSTRTRPARPESRQMRTGADSTGSDRRGDFGWEEEDYGEGVRRTEEVAPAGGVGRVLVADPAASTVGRTATCGTNVAYAVNQLSSWLAVLSTMKYTEKCRS